MHAQMELWQLVAGASFIVQLVMVLLALMLVSVIFLVWKKWILLKLAQRDIRKFENTFWSGVDINKLSHDAQQRGKNSIGLERIFLSGFQEFLRLRTYMTYTPEFVVASVTRAMDASTHKEEGELQKNLSWLATMGAVAPYFGLFGTVIGVMNSFRSLGMVKQVSLSQVAPGIAEALIATAMGLLVAIPAVMAYNHFSNLVNKMMTRYDIFIEEFANILARQYVQIREQAHKQSQSQSQTQQGME